MEAQTPAAPAQPAPEVTAPVTVSASIDAANRDDFTAFDAAEVASRKGTPLPAVEVEAAADPAVPVVSKRQQAINDRVRDAVDKATADTRAENLRLKADLDAARRPAQEPPKPAAAAPVVQPTLAEAKRYAAMPDAPKLEDFESISEHSAAMALFVFQQASADARTAAQQTQFQDQRQRFLADTSQKYGEKLIAARDADPEFLTKIPAEVVNAMPLSGLGKDDRPTFANVAAEAGLYSENPDLFYKYLHANRGEVDRIAALPQDQWLSTLRWLDGRVSASGSVPVTANPEPAAPVAVPSTITSAPAPPQLVQKPGSTTDPKAAAIARDDFAAFDRIETANLRARKSA